MAAAGAVAGSVASPAAVRADPAALKGLGVSLYVGQHFKANLDAAGVPSYFVDYGDGTGTAWADCYGGHNGLCWSHDLDDLMPRLEQALGAS